MYFAQRWRTRRWVISTFRKDANIGERELAPLVSVKMPRWYVLEPWRRRIGRRGAPSRRATLQIWYFLTTASQTFGTHWRHSFVFTADPRFIRSQPFRHCSQSASDGLMLGRSQHRPRACAARTATSTVGERFLHGAGGGSV